MLTDFDFDVSVEDAWRGFRIDLADQLSQLDHGDGHTVMTAPNGPLGRETFAQRAANRRRVA